MSSKAEAQIELSVTVSTDTVSLSQLDEPFSISITAKTVSSSEASLGIIFNAQGSALDDSPFMGGAAYYFGGIKLRSVSDPPRYIALAPAAKVSYTRDSNPDLRRNNFECFYTVPAVGKGELKVSHDLTGHRLFERSRTITPSDISPGEEFFFELPEAALPPRWWTFEKDAERKKFFEGILSDGQGFGGLNDEDSEKVKQLYSEGWLYSFPLRDLKFTIRDDTRPVLKFVK